ncbi:hypothetical protein CDAR_549821 [Caerostris darwini]|uniref:Ribosomal protein S10 n=1 Tax=Caerostris darwini TaxID=1538125 RepID=A0AAV4V230_9ARAC|nr:hypothetical protein CDAR_549821 [Caerostris darwini]
MLNRKERKTSHQEMISRYQTRTIITIRLQNVVRPTLNMIRKCHHQGYFWPPVTVKVDSRVLQIPISCRNDAAHKKKEKNKTGLYISSRQLMQQFRNDRRFFLKKIAFGEHEYVRSSQSRAEQKFLPMLEMGT